MGAFEYTALDAGGRDQSGVLQGDTERQVRQMLRDRGLVPVDVHAVSEGRGASTGLRRRRTRIASADLAVLTRQLATLTEAGLPLEEALRTAADQTERTALRRILVAVRARVMEGYSLSAGLAEFPRAFGELYRATVAAGEEAGHLDRVLSRLADYTESREELARRTWLALLYPVLLVVVALAVVAGLMGYVVPQVTQVFDNLGRELPWLTRALIAVSEGFGTYWWLLAGIIAAAIAATLSVLRLPGPRRAWDRWLLRLPLIGRLVRAVNTARFARTLAICAGSGVEMLESLRIAGDVLGNRAMADAVREARARVREGASLHRALERRGYFAPMATRLIASGERSGRLEAMLERAARTQEREVETVVGALMSVLQPVLILAVGVLVLGIVLAILLPILEFQAMVQ